MIAPGKKYPIVRRIQRLCVERMKELHNGLTTTVTR
jgi:hypothetical protein